MGLLGFPNIAACRAIAGDSDVQLSGEQLIAHPAVIDALNAAHEAHGLLSDEFCDWL